MQNRAIELDFKAFIKHWAERGRSETTARKKWKKQTTPEMIQLGRAFYVGKELWVWQQKPRELMNDDILQCQTKMPDKSVLTDVASAQRMLKGTGGISLSSSCKNMFGDKGGMDMRQLTNGDMVDSDMDSSGDEKDDSGIIGKKDAGKKDAGKKDGSDSSDGDGTYYYD